MRSSDCWRVPTDTEADHVERDRRPAQTPGGRGADLDDLKIGRDPLRAKAKIGMQLRADKLPTRAHPPAGSSTSPDSAARDLRGRDLRAARVDRTLGRGRQTVEQLSGGQQQRLALFVGDDSPARSAAARRGRRRGSTRSRAGSSGAGIERIRTDGGSILLTTHSMEAGQAVCDHVAIIDHGKLLTTETPLQPDQRRHRDDPRVRGSSPRRGDARGRLHRPDRERDP